MRDDKDEDEGQDESRNPEEDAPKRMIPAGSLRARSSAERRTVARSAELLPR